MPWSAAYSASKAASLAFTNSLRQELQGPHTHVMALHVGLMDTDMTSGLDAPKSSPDDVAAQVLDGLDAGAFEVLADDTSRHVRSALPGDLTKRRSGTATDTHSRNTFPAGSNGRPAP